MKLSSNALRDIIAGCERNDRKSQQQLFQAYYGKMLGVSMRYIRDEDLAKDLLQESFIKIFDKISVYNHKGSFEGWVRRIVVNTIIDYLRKKKNELLVLDDEESYDGKFDSHDPEEDDDSIYSRVKPQMVKAAIDSLSPGYKVVFNMYVVEGYSHAEIAEELEISVGTSKSNLAKARQRLKQTLMSELKLKNE